MKYYIYHNVTGLIEAGGGDDKTKVDAQAATKSEWDVIALPRSIRGQVRIDIPGLFVRDWTQAELDAKTAQEETTRLEREARLALIDTKISSFTQDQIETAIDNINDLAGAKAMMKKMAVAIWANFKLDNR